MSRKRLVELQGHRGARGLLPENTLPSFEAALDAGASSIETDVHLSADGALVLFHDDCVSERLCRRKPGLRAVREIEHEPLVSSFTLAELRGFLADRNPDPRRFPRQAHEVTPLAKAYAASAGMHPYAIPTLADLFRFVHAYTGSFGAAAGKSVAQQKCAAKVLFDLEVKRMPFCPEAIGDGFTGAGPGLVERKLVEDVHAWHLARRTRIRSFDHRAVEALKKLEPRLRAAVLVAHTAPISPGALARPLRAEVYAPDYQFVDLDIVQQVHAYGLKVIPWTVNETKDWEKLLAWGVDGITTDYPGELARWLRKQRFLIA